MRNCTGLQNLRDNSISELYPCKLINVKSYFYTYSLLIKLSGDEGAKETSKLLLSNTSLTSLYLEVINLNLYSMILNLGVL